MALIDDFKVVPLRMTPDAKHCHSIYIREHHIRLMDPNKPKGRTLLLLNIPPYVTEVSLKTFFGNVGTVLHVLFAAKAGREETEKWAQNVTDFKNTRVPYTFKVAYVVFKSRSSISKALALDSIDLFSSGTGESLVESGLQLWYNNYNNYILDEDKTQELVDAYMADYDARMAKEAKKSKNANEWTVVSHDYGAEITEGTVERVKKKRARLMKELKNFYTFQIRETKMKEVMEMRRKFEEDKRKIELIKKMRRFKPF